MSAPAPFAEVSGDDAILNFIFSKGSGAIFAAREVAPPPPSPPDAAAAAREAEAVALAEVGNLDAALGILNDLCAAHPTRASAFNNRAQVLKLLRRPEAQKSDVDTAISLTRRWLAAHEIRPDGSPETEHELATQAQRNVLRQALMQRSVYF